MDSAGLGQRSLGGCHEHDNEFQVENFLIGQATVNL
jgi:hypothetical protein